VGRIWTPPPAAAQLRRFRALSRSTSTTRTKAEIGSRKTPIDAIARRLNQAIAPPAQPNRKLAAVMLWSRPPNSQARAAERRTSWKKTTAAPPDADIV